IVVFRDGDPEGSPADKGLIAGLDHLLIEGASVTVTETPTGEDANSILQQHGIEALAELLASAIPAELSPEGECIRLSRLERLEYALERKAAAKRLGIPIADLDREVGRHRGSGAGAGALSSADEDSDEIELMEDPPDLAEVL